ncbi:MAG: hypothetical protein QXU89_05100 [Desulfurococcaceae archaeon]
MKLREFRSKYMIRLIHLRDKLIEKYADQADRVNYLVDVVMNKLKNLRMFTLTDYLHTLYTLCKEIKEFCELIPSQEEVDELMKEKEVEE